MGDRPVNAWETYTLNEAMPWWVLQDLPRREARAEFELTMQRKSGRIEILKKALAESGLVFDGRDASIQSVNDWFVEVMMPLPDAGNNAPDSRSRSICEDTALLLGDLMIERHPELRWDFFIWGKRNVAYHSHVIMGFSTEDPKWHSNLDLSRIIYGYGVQVLNARRGLPVDIEVPQGHPLEGVRMPPLPVDTSEFLTLLGKVARRCQSQERA
ncbi:hypothetical protein ACIQTX_00895 [Microbacterium sp. NPDC090281]|uniref:hypothetical protein n=1 Tax=Microbacterium sp. NPDC090281 TaxID=3364208 RepID=UPI00381C85EB